MADKPVYLEPDQPVSKRVEDLIRRMTIEEKIMQLRTTLDNRYTERTENGGIELSERTKTALADPPPGMVVHLLRSDPFQGKTVETALTPSGAAEAVNKAQAFVMENSRLGVPILIANDNNHMHLGLGATIFPAVCNIGNTWDRDLQFRIAKAISLEARSRGETVSFAPDLDVIRDPRLGRSEQNYGECPYFVGQMGVAMVRGLQGDSLSDEDATVALLRCYPGAGDFDGGRDFGEMSRGPIDMQEVVLRPWGDAVRAGAEGMMIEFAIYDRIPASASRYLLTDVLRAQWGFQGVAVTDSNAVGYLAYMRTEPNHVTASARALKAGVDMAMPDSVFAERVDGKIDGVSYGRLGESYNQGLVSLEDIDRAVRRVLRLKFLLGLFENPGADPERAAAVNRNEDHRKLALEAARKSLVLLKNTNGVLPLSSDGLKAIAVIGPNAHDRWTQIGTYSPPFAEDQVTTILEGIRKKAAPIKVNYAPGLQSIRDGSTDGFPEAVEAAKASDVVVAVVGGSSKHKWITEQDDRRSARYDGDCGEMFDRSSLTLMGAQVELLKRLKKTGKPLVVVLIHGRPMEMPWIVENAGAIISAGYPGEAGGDAVAEALFGDYNPGGRVAVSWPSTVGQIPVHYYSLFQSRGTYADGPSTPLFPFGYGLSYTTFEYGELRITEKSRPFGEIESGGKFEISVEVTNAGAMAGDEVVQLYIRDDIASVVRPAKELRGFERVHLKPGETNRVDFKVGRDELCFFGEAGKWIVEPGTFTVSIRKNAEEEITTGTLILT